MFSSLLLCRWFNLSSEFFFLKFPTAHSCRWKIAWNVSLCCSVLWKSCWWFFLELSIAPYKVCTSLLILIYAVCLIECFRHRSTRLSKHTYDFFISWYSLYIWPLQSNFHFPFPLRLLGVYCCISAPFDTHTCNRWSRRPPPPSPTPSHTERTGHSSPSSRWLT